VIPVKHIRLSFAFFIKVEYILYILFNFFNSHFNFRVSKVKYQLVYSILIQYQIPSSPFPSQWPTLWRERACRRSTMSTRRRDSHAVFTPNARRCRFVLFLVFFYWLFVAASQGKDLTLWERTERSDDTNTVSPIHVNPRPARGGTFSSPCNQWNVSIDVSVDNKTVNIGWTWIPDATFPFTLGFCWRLPHDSDCMTNTVNPVKIKHCAYLTLSERCKLMSDRSSGPEGQLLLSIRYILCETPMKSCSKAQYK